MAFYNTFLKKSTTYLFVLSKIEIAYIAFKYWKGYIFSDFIISYFIIKSAIFL